jgi:hypothetical protein
MKTQTGQTSDLTHLMTELCDLLRRVLGQETDTHIDERIAAMMSDLNDIKLLMERYTVAMEALVPAVVEMQLLKEGQNELKLQLSEQSENLHWLRQKLSQPAFQP